MKIRKKTEIRTRRLACLLILSLIILGGVFVAEKVISNQTFATNPSYCQNGDNTPPEISILGSDTLSLKVGEVYEEFGFETLDDCSSVETSISGSVDTSKLGTYEIIYSSSDEKGNQAQAKRVIHVIPENVGTIYLTFDDGPGPYTAELLDILKEHNVKATFFVTGVGPDELITRAFNEGHTIGAHTNSHVYSDIYRNTDSFWNDFNIINERIKRLTGSESKMMRFPGGSSNVISSLYDGGAKIMSQLTRQASERGLVYFDWNADSGDAGGASTSQQIAQNVINSLKINGDIVILQHDIKKNSVEAVPVIIEYGLSHGYRFDKLTEHSYTARHSVNN